MITDLPINKAYLSAITVTNISQSIYLQDGGKNQLARRSVSSNFSVRFPIGAL